MRIDTQRAGRAAETAAEGHYKNQGFILLHRNYRARGGELDLVMRRGGLLVFVEVKGRSGAWEPYAWQTAWRHKVRCLRRAIGAYLIEHGAGLSYAEIRMELVIVTQGRVVAHFERI